MNPAAPAPVIIVKRKGKGHAGHHGGAWKVAYADFVTAMMALFIVLWLLSSSENARQAIADYFRDPAGTSAHAGNGLAGSGQAFFVKQKDVEKLKNKIEEAFRQIPEFRNELKQKVSIAVSSEGLRIEFIESEHEGTFFQSGSASPTAGAVALLSTLAKEVANLPNNVLIEGHTDSRPYNGKQGYSNWELSADGANAARRLMETAGLRAGQVSQVRGYADQAPRNRADRTDAANRRISVVVQYPKDDSNGRKHPAADSHGKEPPIPKPEPASEHH